MHIAKTLDPTPWLERIPVGRDFLFSLRALYRAKGFSLTIILTLALGMFLTVMVWLFSAWTITSAEGYPHAEEVFTGGFTMDSATSFIPYQIGHQVMAYKDRPDLFSEISAGSYETCNVVVDQEAVGSGAMRIADGSFKMLGMNPVLGRAFRPEEFGQGKDDVVVISARFWKKRFNSDPKILERSIIIDERPCRIIGVLGEKQEFAMMFYNDVYRPWVPTLDPANPFKSYMVNLLRLRKGVSREQAEQAMKKIQLNLSPKILQYLHLETLTLRKPNQVYRPEVFRMLFGAALFLFAISCLNAVNLMLVRVLGRSREFSIRRAIGGSQMQVVSLVMIEAIIISCVAGTLVYLCASLFGIKVLSVWSEYTGEGSLWGSWTMVECLLVLMAIVVVVLTASCSWRIKHTNINAGLKDGGAAAGEGRRANRWRTILVALQAAFAVILLTGAGLMIRTFQNTAKVDLGLDPNGKLNVLILYPNFIQPDNETRLQHLRDLEEAFRHLPGVRAVGFGSSLNFFGYSGGGGEPTLRLPDGNLVSFSAHFISAQFPEAAGLRLVRGRWMSQSKGAQEVCISESLARVRFGDEDPVGQLMMIKNEGKDWVWTVTGVVKDIRPGLRVKPGNVVYEISSWWPPGSTTLLLRYDSDPGPENESLIRRTVYKVNPHLIMASVSTLNEELRRSQALERQVLNILRWLSAVALTLASIGLFSVLAYNVDRRRSEFGVRLAMGAMPGDILWLVLRQGLITAGIGVVAGCGAALGLARLMTSLLYETRTFEPVVYVCIAAILMAAACLACWAPARRAARIDISRLLRTE